MPAIALDEIHMANSPAKVNALRRRLPPHSQKILKAHEQAALESRIHEDARTEQRNKLREHKRQLEFERDGLQKDKERGVAWSDENEEKLKELSTGIESIAADIKELAAPNFVRVPKERVAFHRIRYACAPNLEDWFASLPERATFIPCKAELPNGATKKSLADVRKQQADVIEKLVTLERAPLDMETAIARMKRNVAAMAAKGAPNLRGVTSYRIQSGERKSQGDIRWPSESVKFHEYELGVAFCVWMFREEVEKRFEREIREAVALENGLSVEARQKTEADLKAELLRLDRQEVRICRELGDEPGRVHPLAYLEIERGPDEEPKRRDKSRHWPVNTGKSVGVPRKVADGWTAVVPKK
jgi:hypothetical protein